jgi:poly(3-hydroxybutyrate) depolymerase
VVLACAACGGPSEGATAPLQSSAVLPPTASGAQPEPAPPPGALGRLEVAGFGPAVVWVPPPSEAPRPLLVAAHGAGGSPEYHCEFWGSIVGARGFVLCLRGRPAHFGGPEDYSGYYFPDHHWLSRALDAALDAIEQRYAPHLDSQRAVYAGFSQGAIMGALVIAKDPARFPRAVFIEGGGGEWNVVGASAYLKGGGERVAFACGISACNQQAQRALRYLTQAGLPARAVHVPGAGHTYAGALEAEVRALFEWVLEGDPRWR